MSHPPPVPVGAPKWALEGWHNYAVTREREDVRGYYDHRPRPEQQALLGSPVPTCAACQTPPRPLLSASPGIRQAVGLPPPPHGPSTGPGTVSAVWSSGRRAKVEISLAWAGSPEYYSAADPGSLGKSFHLHSLFSSLYNDIFVSQRELVPEKCLAEWWVGQVSTVVVAVFITSACCYRGDRGVMAGPC